VDWFFCGEIRRSRQVRSPSVIAGIKPPRPAAAAVNSWPVIPKKCASRPFSSLRQKERTGSPAAADAASTQISHSVSNPSDRLFRFVDPIPNSRVRTGCGEEDGLNSPSDHIERVIPRLFVYLFRPALNAAHQPSDHQLLLVCRRGTDLFRLAPLLVFSLSYVDADAAIGIAA
jgi:hypothetical protein